MTKNLKSLFKSPFRLIHSIIQRASEQRLVAAIDTLPMEDGITLVDVGAAGDIEPRWRRIEQFIQYVGFEPDDRSRIDLLTKPNNCLSYTIRAEALGNKANEEVDFYLCEKPQVSSSFYPRTEFLKLFPDSKRFNVDKTERVTLTRLDDIAIERADFIKLDIQGSELNVLRGSTHTLGRTLGLEVEVEFLKLYEEQPLFGEVAEFLAEQGFEFIDFTNLCRWQRTTHDGLGQCVFGDALFLRTPEYVVAQPNTISRVSSYLACLLLYNRYDLISKTLELLPDSQSDNFYRFRHSAQSVARHFNYAAKINRYVSLLTGCLAINGRTHLIY